MPHLLPEMGALNTETMSAHCHDCKARFRVPLSPPWRCPVCGSGQVIDHNLEPLAPAEQAAAILSFRLALATAQ
jgi:hypothetical protein